METGNTLRAYRGKGGGRVVRRRGRDQSKNMSEWPTDKNNSVGIRCREARWAGRRRTKRKNWDNCNRINKIFKKVTDNCAHFKEIFFKIDISTRCNCHSLWFDIDFDLTFYFFFDQLVYQNVVYSPHICGFFHFLLHSISNFKAFWLGYS